jgi:hypothetical protein
LATINFDKSINSYENAGEHVSEGNRRLSGWSDAEDRFMESLFYGTDFGTSGTDIGTVAKILGRSTYAVVNRLQILKIQREKAALISPLDRFSESERRSLRQRP